MDDEQDDKLEQPNQVKDTDGLQIEQKSQELAEVTENQNKADSID